MAGSERSGPLAATAALFDGRPVGGHAARARRPGRRRRWSTALAAALRRRRRCGSPRSSTTGRSRAPPTCRTCSPRWPPARLADAPPEHLALSGPGRPRRHPRSPRATRSCGEQIIRANTDARSATCCATCAADLDALLARARRAATGRASPRSSTGAWPAPGDPRQARRAGARETVGVRRRCPTTPASWPGCSPTSGEIGVNVEDLHIDHDPGRPSGLVELVAWPRTQRRATCWRSLEARGTGRTHR